jgi:hypothetical protein
MKVNGESATSMFSQQSKSPTQPRGSVLRLKNRLDIAKDNTFTNTKPRKKIQNKYLYPPLKPETCILGPVPRGCGLTPHPGSPDKICSQARLCKGQPPADGDVVTRAAISTPQPQMSIPVHNTSHANDQYTAHGNYAQ